MKSLDITLVPIICRIVNVSLTTGILPTSEKKAAITPVLKKPGLDPNVLLNYRPISCPTFLSKFIERVVFNRINTYISHFSLQSPFQSAYRKHFSTETALVKFFSDVAVASDSHKLSLVVSLDLSSAFDTVEHSILLDRLYKRFGIRDTALSWLTSFLSDRSFCVSINNSISPVSRAPYGVPQGSVLGPLLYSLFVTPISDVVSYYGLQHFIYADDLTIYFAFDPLNPCNYLENLQNCLDHVFDWFSSNRLKINPDKSVVFLAGSKHALRNVNFFDVFVCDNNLPVSCSVKLLGVTFDRFLSFDDHVSKIRRKCFLHLRNLYRIRKFVNRSNLHALVHCFIFTHLDYCNALFPVCKAGTIDKLQRILHSAARLVRNLPRSYRGISSLLKDLRWLPVKDRVRLKLSCLVHQAVYGSAPYYLQSMLSPAASSRASVGLRSQRGLLLRQPTFRRTLSRAAFCASGPNTWNSLPLHLRNLRHFRTFKRETKKFLLG